MHIKHTDRYWDTGLRLWLHSRRAEHKFYFYVTLCLRNCSDQKSVQVSLKDNITDIWFSTSYSAAYVVVVRNPQNIVFNFKYFWKETAWTKLYEHTQHSNTTVSIFLCSAANFFILFCSKCLAGNCRTFCLLDTSFVLSSAGYSLCDRCLAYRLHFGGKTANVCLSPLHRALIFTTFCVFLLILLPPGRCSYW
jgi:hypothetical protein